MINSYQVYGSDYEYKNEEALVAVHERDIFYLTDITPIPEELQEGIYYLTKDGITKERYLINNRYVKGVYRISSQAKTSLYTEREYKEDGTLLRKKLLLESVRIVNTEETNPIIDSILLISTLDKYINGVNSYLQSYPYYHPHLPLSGSNLTFCVGNTHEIFRNMLPTNVSKAKIKNIHVLENTIIKYLNIVLKYESKVGGPYFYILTTKKAILDHALQKFIYRNNKMLFEHKKLLQEALDYIGDREYVMTPFNSLRNGLNKNPTTEVLYKLYKVLAYDERNLGEIAETIASNLNHAIRQYSVKSKNNTLRSDIVILKDDVITLLDSVNKVLKIKEYRNYDFETLNRYEQIY